MPRKASIGPERPDMVARGLDGQTCQIVFGHNAEARRVLMMFGVAADRLIFTPEEADDVAQKLQYYAKAARGEKAS